MTVSYFTCAYLFVFTFDNQFLIDSLGNNLQFIESTRNFFKWNGKEKHRFVVSSDSTIWILYARKSDTNWSSIGNGLECILMRRCTTAARISFALFLCENHQFNFISQHFALNWKRLDCIRWEMNQYTSSDTRLIVSVLKPQLHRAIFSVCDRL